MVITEHKKLKKMGFKNTFFFLLLHVGVQEELQFLLQTK